ncbi:sensor histidine kinase [Raineyella sp. LH-20]|uniref:sensor histidine kinase n=1 Tax=Raineyella sp. LH-20 TaxID=3081204 RepID=UPI002953C14E|nr:ATP-binding protein [Raineyella sp. LH-20]WOP17307.1 ATP-binding protein [Raineyella sp. LH-20]
MNAYLAAGGGLLVGLLLGIAVMLLRVQQRRAQEDRLRVEMAARVTVRPEVSQVLSVLRSGAMVVGPHDEVLQSTAQARTLGVVRGARVVVPAVLTLVRKVREDRQSRSTELDLKRDGLSLHLMARVAPLDDRTLLVLVEDRTAARRVDETRRDFVANISHELKTPIGAVTLLAETLEEAADSPDDVRRFARRLQVEGARLSDLVRQIIDLSRLQSDDPLLDQNEVLVDDVIGDAVDRNRVDADDRHVALTVAGTSGLEVLGDEEQLTVAVANLIENAIMYSERGARVAVAARAVVLGEEDFVEISVSDNGIGIPEDEVERIFERFYRVDYARSRDNGGTGLGLSIVKHIAAAHGGYVHVWSKLGQGSTFTIRIPQHYEREVAADDPSVDDHDTMYQLDASGARGAHSQEVEG